MNAPKLGNGAVAEQLCLACALCCNGVLFADVKLQAGDNASRLRQSGLKLKSTRNRSLAFTQPCQALDCRSCRIYTSRPLYCRQFECLQLMHVETGKTAPRAALQKIHLARRRVERVLRLLRELADTEEHLPIAARFRRTSLRLRQIGVGPSHGEIFGRLTLAIHKLNFLLQVSFYPRAGHVA